ncbi:MAG TPA: methylmalonyl Co-A mutase-associated GTPase MeaB [Bacillota bacterium]|nr:methylmalonyl Co-A mutase-associated GTPase MeaB [Bacillota bacterium]
MHPLVERIKNKDVRALARAITKVENDHPDKLNILSDVFAWQTNAHMIGITGSPGAGKSTLVNRLITHIRALDLTVAVIAVDPTSPFSGGALLGDRIRMNHHFTDEGVFIRSMATRGSLGGLARSTKDVIRICDAYGFDVIIVETVGVGQSELDIMKIVDTTAVVLTPNSGDVLQVFKAGIMEIADLFIINKSDLPGVGRLRGLLKELVAISATDEYKIPIIKVIATENKGIAELWKSFTDHYTYLYETTAGRTQRERQWELEVMELIREEIWRDVSHYMNERPSLLVQEKLNDPYRLAKQIYGQWKEHLEGLDNSCAKKS